MSTTLRNGLLAVAALAALAGGYLAAHGWRGESADDATLADFSLPDLNGKERWLSEWQGKIVVLNFWAPWCGPCREEMPLLKDAHQHFQGQGVRVVGVAIDNREAVTRFAKELRIDYPLLIGDEAGLSLMARYGDSRGVLPYTVVIAPDGRIAAKKLGAFRNQELSELLVPLVKASFHTNMPK